MCTESCCLVAGTKVVGDCRLEDENFELKLDIHEPFRPSGGGADFLSIDFDAGAACADVSVT